MSENHPQFILNAPLSCFPSDNRLDAMSRSDRIGIKQILKNWARILTLEWLQKQQIRHSTLSKRKPLIDYQVRVILRVYLRKGTTLDVHNLSIKHFLDEIVKMGVIRDDSIKEIPEVVQTFCGYISKESYAEFEISKYETY